MLTEEQLYRANEIAAELFECKTYQVTDRQLNFVLTLCMGLEI